MRGFIAKFVAALRRMGSFTTRLVKRGGQWIAELVYVPAAAEPAVEMVPDTTPSKQDDYTAVRDLAKAMASGADAEPEMLKGMPAQTVKWLSAMNRRQLCQIALAEDSAIRGHMRGTTAIRGVAPFDKAAIDDVAAAKDKPRPRDRQPTLRDLLEEKAGVSLAA